jgi:hypothetical protein
LNLLQDEQVLDEIEAVLATPMPIPVESDSVPNWQPKIMPKTVPKTMEKTMPNKIMPKTMPKKIVPEDEDPLNADPLNADPLNEGGDGMSLDSSHYVVNGTTDCYRRRNCYLYVRKNLYSILL